MQISRVYEGYKAKSAGGGSVADVTELLSWIIQVCPHCNHKCPGKRGRRDCTQEERERQRDPGSRALRNERPHRNWRNRNRFSPRACGGCVVRQPPDFGLLILILGFLVSRTMRRINFHCFRYQVYGNLCWIVINIEVAKNKEFYWGSHELQFGRHGLGRKPKECSGEEKESGTHKDISHMACQRTMTAPGLKVGNICPQESQAVLGQGPSRQIGCQESSRATVQQGCWVGQESKRPDFIQAKAHNSLPPQWPPGAW